MMRPARATPPVRSVGQLVRYIRGLLKDNRWLREIGVRGEISNLRRNNNNVYFDLKDDEAILNCVVWSDNAGLLPELQNGLAVVAIGYIDTFVKASRYQLVAHSVTLDGVGDLHAEIEKLKKKLEAEGAFATERKRKLPRFPYRIALVSSSEARGMGDFVTIVAKRAPHVEVVLVETPVQGTGAAIEIADAIDRASRLDVDVIVVARGGGSFEDLLPFSTKTVARAILRARHPVVTAIGHEYDVSIADMVADVRAETPSAAAHLVVPDRDELLRRIDASLRRIEGYARQKLRLAVREFTHAFRYSGLAEPLRFLGPRHQRLDRATSLAKQRIDGLLRRRRERLVALERRLDRFDPRRRLAERGKALEVARYRLDRAAEVRLARERDRLERATVQLVPAMQTGYARRLNTLQLLRAKLLGHDPEAILQQGYAIVSYGGRVVCDPESVPVGGLIRAQVARGTITARVEDRRRDGPE
jgi:exodeoxyribonuclease VII large subunit